MKKDTLSAIGKDPAVQKVLETAMARVGELDGNDQTFVSEILFRGLCYADAPLEFPQFVESLTEIPSDKVLIAIMMPSRVRLSEQQEQGLAGATMVYGMGLAIESLREKDDPLAVPAIFEFLRDAVAKEHEQKGPFDSTAQYRIKAIDILGKLSVG